MGQASHTSVGAKEGVHGILSLHPKQQTRKQIHLEKLSQVVPGERELGKFQVSC